MKKKFTIQKVSVETLMAALENIMGMGIEWVDMELSASPDGDKIEFIESEEVIKLLPLTRENCKQLIYLGP